MKAWQVHENGEPTDVLRRNDVADPVPRANEVLVRVESVALNFPDVLLCRGQYQERPPLPFTPGLEVSGEVVAVGADTAGRRVGDRVLGTPSLPGGGLAELCVLERTAVFPELPELTSAQNAAVFITYQTGYVALHTRAQLAAGETLLVHGGAGGVGSAAIQLGKAAGATVIATAGGTAKTEVCRRLGADHAIDYEATDFVAQVKELTAGRGADVIYDPVGGDVFERSLKCIAFEGRILVIGFTSGRFGTAPTNLALVKNYSVVGMHWNLYRTRRPEVVTETFAALGRLAAAGDIFPLVSEELPMADAPHALERLGARRTVGKVVVHPYR